MSDEKQGWIETFDRICAWFGVLVILPVVLYFLLSALAQYLR